MDLHSYFTYRNEVMEYCGLFFYLPYVQAQDVIRTHSISIINDPIFIKQASFASFVFGRIPFVYSF